MSEEEKADVKMELAIAPSTHSGGGVRKHTEVTCRSSNGSSAIGSCSSIGSVRRIGRTTPAASGHGVAVKSEVVSSEADAGVKMELGVSGPSR